MTALSAILMLSATTSHAITIYNINDIQYKMEPNDGSADTAVGEFQSWIYADAEYTLIGAPHNYALFYFNLANINLYEHRTIETVSVNFTLSDTHNASLIVYEADRPWAYNVGGVYWWGLRPEPLGASIAEVPIDSTLYANVSFYADVDVDITDVFMKWIDDPASNNGIIIQAVNDNMFPTVDMSEFSGPTLTISYAAIPEPCSLLLVGSALIAIRFRRMMKPKN